MINKLIDKFFSLFDNSINKLQDMNKSNIEFRKERPEKFKDLDRIIEDKSIEDVMEQKRHEEREKNFEQIIFFARLELVKAVDTFNEFLKKYNLKFGKVKLANYSTVNSDLKGLNKTVSLSIHINYNDKDMYRDFKENKFTYTYDLSDYKPYTRWASSKKIDEVLEKFVDAYKDELKNRIS